LLVTILNYGDRFCSFRIVDAKRTKSVAIKTVFFESPPKVGFQKKNSFGVSSAKGARNTKTVFIIRIAGEKENRL